MNTLHSPFGAPRKELINGLQKGVVVLLFVLLLSFVGMYMLMTINLERQNAQQEKLSAFFELVHSAEEHWLEWLLAGDSQIFNENGPQSSSPSHLHQMLVSEYRLIESNIDDFGAMDGVDLAGSLVLLNTLSQRELDSSPLLEKERIAAYFSFKGLEALDDRLLQISVDLDYQRQIFIERLIWVPVAIFLLIVIVVLLLASRLARQLRSGFISLHYVLDHRKHGHVSILAPRNVVDEFTDLSHLVDNELASRDFDLNQQEESLNLIEKALSQVDVPFLVTNHEGDVVWLSAGAERLWFRNTALFESLFGIDSGLDDPIGERVSDSILLSDQALRLKLSDGIYWLSVGRFISESGAEPDNLQRIISIQIKSEMAEFDVLHHSLKLIEQDVWNAPIRILRADSPYAGFAKSLEVVRRKVVRLFDSLNAASVQTNNLEKITKLQQIAYLIDEKTNHNEQLVNDVIAIEEIPFEGLQVELNDMAWLSEQVRDSLILGYELVLQRLALVEKDLSSDVFLLADVDRCLNEVRAGVLSSLAATEGESEKIRHRFAIDVEHDISKVQDQIEAMKSMAASTLSLLESDRSVGVARLDRARESINEMVERIHSLMAKTTSNISEAAIDVSLDDAPLDDAPLKESNDEWDEWGEFEYFRF